MNFPGFAGDILGFTHSSLAGLEGLSIFKPTQSCKEHDHHAEDLENQHEDAWGFCHQSWSPTSGHGRFLMGTSTPKNVFQCKE